MPALPKSRFGFEIKSLGAAQDPTCENPTFAEEPASNRFELLGDFNSGGRCQGTNELTPPTVGLTYHERWAKVKIDLLELVTLREAGGSLQSLAKRFGVSRQTVLRRLRFSKQGG